MKKKWKWPALKGKSKIKEGEHLSSLGKEKKKFQSRKEPANAKS